MHIIANWKSNKSTAAARSWVNDFSKHSLALAADCQLGLAPAFPLIPTVAKAISSHLRDRVNLGAQDISEYDAGAYTGSVSAENLKDYQVQFVIVGHSERRKYFGETSQQVAGKTRQTFTLGATPIICVDTDTLDSQLNQFDTTELSQAMVAFEPAAAIGSGQPESVEVVRDVCQSIKNKYSPQAVLYGGSVTAGEVSQYVAACDGFLVGSASLDPQKFAQLVLAATN